MTYQEFLNTKRKFHRFKGISVYEDALNGDLKEFQKFSVKTALNKGRFALFEDCGLGKTFQQLEWANQVSRYTDKQVLILAPLAVTGQTIQEGKKFGIDVDYPHNDNVGIHITNYEQLLNIDTSIYSGVVLDESSILKNFQGKYRNLIIDTFRNTPYKLPCTATPSPNDPMELGNHAEFLGLMSRNEMLATYFIHDGGQTSKWRLKKHATDKFWQWVCSWALIISKPSDIGFSDEGYILPKLNFIEERITTDAKDGLLFNDVAVSATDYHNELRRTSKKRLKRVIDIAQGKEENFIIWVEQNTEGDYLEKNIPGAVQVKGSDADEFKKRTLLDFANNKFRILITKPKIASFGMNFQNCHNQIFASPDHSFEKTYQAIRRSLRFGQKYDVNAYMIVTDTMQSVIKSFERKERQHNEMITQSINHIKKLYGYERVTA